MGRPSRRQLVIGAAFIGAATAIAANAVLLQPRRHPAPLELTREASETGGALDSDLVRAIQSALREQGYYHGPLDGIAGAETAAAIRAFEAASGAATTGRPESELLRNLVLTQPPDAAAPEAGVEVVETEESPPPQRDRLVAAVQRALAQAAYGPVEADGVIGPQTRAAILRFQQDHGLPPTGELTDALVVELRAVGALEEE